LSGSVSTTYDFDYGAVLPADLDVLPGVPWTLSCQSNTPPKPTAMALPFGLVDGVDVMLFSCTSALISTAGDKPVSESSGGGGLEDVISCMSEPLALSDAAAKYALDTDPPELGKLGARPVITVTPGTAAFPLEAWIVESRYNSTSATSGSINVPFTISTEQYLRNHAEAVITSVEVTVDLFNVFGNPEYPGTALPQCQLLDPLGSENEDSPWMKSIVLSYGVPEFLARSGELGIGYNVAVKVTNFPLSRLNTLLILTCSSLLYQPTAYVGRVVTVSATVNLVYHTPFTAKYVFSGVQLDGMRGSLPSPPRELPLVGFEKTSIVFVRNDQVRGRCHCGAASSAFQ